MKESRPSFLWNAMAVACFALTNNSQALSHNHLVSEPKSNLSAQTLKNGVYTLKDCHDKPIRLRNGKASGSYTSIFGWFCKLEALALGDLNGDGDGDGVVVLGFNGGGSGYFLRLVGVINESGRATQVATQELGDRVQIEQVSIKSQVVKVTLLAHGLDDSMADLSVRKTITLRLTKGRWKIISEVERKLAATI